MPRNIFDQEFDILESMERDENFEVFTQGKTAKLSGENIFSNPYPVTTAFNQIWRDGFTSVKS